MDLTDQTLAKLRQDMAEDEAQTREKIDRLAELDCDTREQQREEWSMHCLRIRPLRDQYDYIVKQIAAVKALGIPAPIIIEKEVGSPESK